MQVFLQLARSLEKLLFVLFEVAEYRHGASVGEAVHLLRALLVLQHYVALVKQVDSLLTQAVLEVASTVDVSAGSAAVDAAAFANSARPQDNAKALAAMLASVVNASDHIITSTVTSADDLLKYCLQPRQLQSHVEALLWEFENELSDESGALLADISLEFFSLAQVLLYLSRCS